MKRLAGCTAPPGPVVLRHSAVTPGSDVPCQGVLNGPCVESIRGDAACSQTTEGGLRRDFLRQSCAFRISITFLCTLLRRGNPYLAVDQTMAAVCQTIVGTEIKQGDVPLFCRCCCF